MLVSLIGTAASPVPLAAAAATAFLGIFWFVQRGFQPAALSAASAATSEAGAAAAAAAGKPSADSAAGHGPGLPPSEHVAALIKKRRSIFPRDFNGQKVECEHIEAMLEAANWAPTHNLTEPWRFVVIEGDSKEQFEDLTIDACRCGFCVTPVTGPCEHV